MAKELNNTEELTEEQEKEQLSEQHRIRLEKLAELKQAGKDPYEITKFEVSHNAL